MPHDLPKAYDPTAIEDHWAEYWVREKLFAQPTPDPARRRPQRQRPGRPVAFTILLPPPNVTGHLHMGHMLEHTEIDILDPLAAHVRRPRPVGAGHRPRRHRHADAGRAPAR